MLASIEDFDAAMGESTMHLRPVNGAGIWSMDDGLRAAPRRLIADTSDKALIPVAGQGHPDVVSAVPRIDGRQQ